MPELQKLVTLPDKIAKLVLAEPETLPELVGICHGALDNDGRVRPSAGYDPRTKMWSCGAEIPPIPEFPTFAQTQDACIKLRDTVATFPFRGRVLSATGTTDFSEGPRRRRKFVSRGSPDRRGPLVPRTRRRGC